MSEKAFSSPIEIQIPGYGRRRVATVFEALECLERDWPKWARDRYWRAAQFMCRNALDGWCSAKAARNRLLKAAQHARLTFKSRNTRRSGHHPLPEALQGEPGSMN